MIAKIRKILIEKTAKEVLQNIQFNTLPISPIKIAEKINIAVRAKPSTSYGVSGMLIKKGDNFGIMYATHIKNKGFQNFSIAHELGHYYLDGHVENILTNGIHYSDIDSQANKYEQEANYFASVLLMPSHLMQDDIRRNDLSWQLASDIANKCQTSLEAAARRIVSLSQEHCALLIQQNNKLWHPIKSNSWSRYLNNPQFPGQLDYCDYENLTNDMEECSLSDWDINNILANEYQCQYSSIHYKDNKIDKIMTLLLLEEKDD